MMKWVVEGMAVGIGKKWTSWEHDSFQKSENSDYWDGYRNQMVMYYNDMFQIKTEEAITTTAIELIKAAQTSAYPLNMADVNDKGTYFFTSELICADTNVNLATHCKTLADQYMVDAGALLRRFDVRVADLS